MIDHLGIAGSDFDVTRRFYEAALAPLGITVMMEVTPEESGGYHGVGLGRDKPFLWLSNGPAKGSGIHIAFAADTRAQVDGFYQAAIAAGGRDNGAPGIREHYHPNYYAAFIFDPDGTNVEAVCQKPE